MNLAPSTLKKIGAGLAVVLLALMLARFAVHSYGRAITNSNSGEGDQGAFLQLGLDLREHGTLTDGTRNPLYAAVLAVLAHREWDYFTQAKLASMAFGLLTIVAVFVLGWRYFNPFTGIVAAWLVSINVEFVVHSATALTESLLVLLFTLAWFAMLRALDRPDRWGIWALAGALTALAYLAKGSGQLLGYAFLLTGLLLYRLDLFRGKKLWAFLLAYLVTVSPLWIYNTVHFGSPTFNYAISHQMWMDSWSEWHPNDTANLPTAASYLQTHTPAQIFEREWTGLLAERNMLVKTLYPTRTLLVDRFLLSPLSWYALLALLLLPLIFRRSSGRFVARHRAAVILSLLTVSAFFVLFAWYHNIISTGTRFLLPLMPLIFVMGAYILSLILQNIYRRGRWGQAAVAALLLAVVFLQAAWWLKALQAPLNVLRTANVFAHDREFGENAGAPLAWLAAGYPGATVAWGPSGHSLPAWAYSDRLNFVLYPPNPADIPSVTANFNARGVDFVVVDPEMVARHKNLLRDVFPTNGSTIDLTTIPAGWAPTFAYPGLPCQWCIFRLADSAPPQHPADFQLAESIQLTGFDLAASELHPGDTVRLTLHWRSDVPVPQDWTVFTQLLGPDFQLHGQLDHPPVNGLWPTSRWQPGSPVADRYDIPLDEAAPPGQYHVLVGMYNPVTGERAPVTQNGQPVPDNAIFLTTLTTPHE